MPETSTTSGDRTLTKDVRGYYVIVGRGFCGVLDHVTLRASEWGRRRIGDLPVLHVGFENPWSLYRPHRMGQYPHLLALPGFAPAAAPGQADDYELSSRFAATVGGGLDRLVANGDAEIRDGWVALIQGRDGDLAPPGEVIEGLGLRDQEIDELQEYDATYPPYRLLVVDPEGRRQLVYAWKIDLCTGGGPPRIIEVPGIDQASYAAYKGEPWWPPASRRSFRYLISGVEALNAASPLPQGTRLCIYGTGGVGVNLVEMALEAGKWVDWMDPGRHDEIFIPSGRNDRLLAPGKVGRPLPRPLVPFDRRLRFGEGVGLANVTLAKVTFGAGKPVDGKPAGPDPPEVSDFYQGVVVLEGGEFPYGPECLRDGAPGQEVYGQLILPRGLDAKGLGGAASLAGALSSGGGLVEIPWKGRGDRPEDRRMVGLQDRSGDLRILGSAATAIFANDSSSRDRLEGSWIYVRTLPAQARVGLAGITYNAVTIALANQYFNLRNLNRNVNTAHTSELQEVLGSEALADEIVRLRSGSLWGFHTREELIAELRTSEAALPAHWEKTIERLLYSYA
jgi:hypothetical protein